VTCAEPVFAREFQSMYVSSKVIVLTRAISLQEELLCQTATLTTTTTIITTTTMVKSLLHSDAKRLVTVLRRWANLIIAQPQPPALGCCSS